MATYTINGRFFEFICTDKVVGYNYFANVLMIFAQNDQLKISVDDNKKAIEIYHKIIKLYNREDLKIFLDAMTNQNKFERIYVDNIENILEADNIFLEICYSTKNGRTIITDSHQTWSVAKYIEDRKNVICYREVEINVLDKDDAKRHFSETLNHKSTTMSNQEFTAPDASPKESNKSKIISIVLLVVSSLALIIKNSYREPEDTKSAGKEVCYPIVLIDQKTNRPAEFKDTKVQLVIHRNGTPTPLPLTRANCKYCTNDKIEPTERVLLTIDNTNYSIVGTSHSLKDDSENQIYVLKGN